MNELSRTALALALGCSLLMGSCKKAEESTGEWIAEPTPPPGMRVLWPPPKASASVRIPDSMIVKQGSARPTLGQVSAVLERALEGAGYLETTYFSVPGGFCLATRMEQIGDDGTPKAGAARWIVDAPTAPTDLSSYIRALFTAPAGLYRVVLVVVTPATVSTSERAMTQQQMTTLVGQGAVTLPAEVQEMPFTPRHHCVGLIYEFRKAGGETSLTEPSRIDGQTHLRRAGLWSKISP